MKIVNQTLQLGQKTTQTNYYKRIQVTAVTHNIQDNKLDKTIVIRQHIILDETVSYKI